MMPPKPRLASAFWERTVTDRSVSSDRAREASQSGDFSSEGVLTRSRAAAVAVATMTATSRSAARAGPTSVTSCSARTFGSAIRENR